VKRRVAMVSLDKDLLDAVLSDVRFDIVGIFDARSETAFGVPSLGPDSNWDVWLPTAPDVGLIFAIDVPGVRRTLAAKYGLELGVTVVVDGAYVSARAEIGHASIVQRGAFVSADAVLGEAVKVNVQAAIHHDVRVGAYSTVAPGARLLGSVEIGDDVYIGTGAVVLPRKRIGARAVIGAGAVVTRDVAEDEVVVGVPGRARELSRR
jgi:sugar O-acyltransferase (sialic acid O-acetyltransferase NeuD family)